MKKLLLFSGICLFTLQTSAQAIFLDNTFNTDGLYPLIFDQTLAHTSDIAVQPDGKILGSVSGYSTFRIYRLNTDGTLDNSFGANHDGLVELSFNGTNGNEECEAIEILPDGKIIVAGSGVLSGNLLRDVIVVRLTDAGIVDSTFGINGIATQCSFLDTWSEKVCDLIVHPDGKVLVLGTANANGAMPQASFMCRYNADGTIQTGWGGGLGLIMWYPPASATHTATGFAMHQNGRILTISDRMENGSQKVLLIPFVSGGTPQYGWGEDTGKIWISHGAGVEIGVKILVQSTDKIIVCSRNTAEPEKIFMDRYTATGELDLSFGTNGTASYSFGMPLQTVVLGDVILTPEDDIIVGGSTGGGVNTADYRVMYFNGSDGSVNSGWADNGGITTDFIATNDRITAMSLQADGKLLAAGTTVDNAQAPFGPKPSIARYIQIEPANISEVHDAKELVVYPNPSQGLVTIQSDKAATLNIVNALGQVIRTVELSTKNNFRQQVEGLPQGVFYIQSKDGTVNNKIVSL